MTSLTKIEVNVSTGEVTEVPLDAQEIADIEAAREAIANAPPAVPQSVTPRQARKALLAFGLLDDVEAAVAAASREVQIDWEFALEIRRDNPVIATMAATLELSEADVDALFLAASQVS